MAGLAASLALLCKQEFGAACYLMLAFVLVMEAIPRRSVRPLLHGIAACAPGVALWVAIYGWFFWTLTPALMVDGNWLGAGSYFSHTGMALHLLPSLGQRFIPREMVATDYVRGSSVSCCGSFSRKRAGDHATSYLRSWSRSRGRIDLLPWIR